MFYSQTFLARKGPLGTVWCAAHLQHRLKKSHYTSTDIPSTVDRIMFPEVPIALRMSSHLLLGVVRIYKKKVDYLFQDCTVVLVGLNKAFTTIEVNLPENATTATFESITLPPTLSLDGFDMSDYLDPEGSPDNNLKSYEEITLTDQISPYITVHIDEDNIFPSVSEQDLSSEATPVDDIHPPPPVNDDLNSQDRGQRTQTDVNNETLPGASNQTDVLVDNMDFQDIGPSNQPEDPMDTGDFQDLAPSNQTEVLMHTGDFQDPGPSNQTLEPTETLNQSLNEESSPPEIEVMRDAATDLGSEGFPPLSPARRDDATEQNRSVDEVLNEKDFLSPIMEDALPSLEKSLPFQQHSKAPTSATSQDIPDIFDTHGSFGNVSPQFAIRSTPPVQQPQPGPPPAQQPRPRRRRKMQFDEATVLTNRFMKTALEDSSDLIRQKRMKLSSTLGIWRLNNSLRKDQIFYEPLITEGLYYYKTSFDS
uniref:Rad21/Rec8-like protein N-terminal domain-containing protein n=1 Tax=Salix viminalis TaxID=40686 RepID=A0A6N2MNS0_SALVM